MTHSPNLPMALKKKYQAEAVCWESQSQTMVKESVTFPEGVSKARKILMWMQGTVTDDRIEKERWL